MRICPKVVVNRLDPEKNGFKPVLLLHSPSLFLGGKRKRVRNNQLSYISWSIRFSPASVIISWSNSLTAATQLFLIFRNVILNFLFYFFWLDTFYHNFFCIPESFNTNISHQSFDYKITLLNLKRKNTNSKVDFVLKDWF